MDGVDLYYSAFGCILSVDGDDLYYSAFVCSLRVDVTQDKKLSQLSSICHLCVHKSYMGLYLYHTGSS